MSPGTTVYIYVFCLIYKDGTLQRQMMTQDDMSDDAEIIRLKEAKSI